MKKILILIIVVVLIVSFTGCTETPEPKTNEDGNGKASSEETIQDILAKAEKNTNFEYELYTESNLSTNIEGTKIFVKGGKWRFEDDISNGTIIFDGENTYLYYYNDDVYIQSGSMEGVFFDLTDLSNQALNDSSLKEIGKEKIDGINTRKIEFNYKAFSGKEKVKAWVSESKGIIIKIEEETGTIIEMKNIVFNSVSDSLFEVPEDKIQSIEEYFS